MDDKKFDFLTSFVNYLQIIFNKIKEKGNDLSNDEFKNLGRSEAEKETIQEICEDIDSQCEMMKDLEESGLDPQSWYQQRSAELLADCDDETFEEIKRLDAEIKQMQLKSDLAILDNMSEHVEFHDEHENKKQGGK